MEAGEMIVTVSPAYVRLVELQARLEAEKAHLEALKAQGCNDSFRFAEVGSAMNWIADELAKLGKEIDPGERIETQGESGVHGADSERVRVDTTQAIVPG